MKVHSTDPPHKMDIVLLKLSSVWCRVGVMFNNIENGIDKRDSVLGRGCLHSLCTNALWKRQESTPSPLFVGKQHDRHIYLDLAHNKFTILILKSIWNPLDRLVVNATLFLQILQSKLPPVVTGRKTTQEVKSGVGDVAVQMPFYIKIIFCTNLFCTSTDILGMMVNQESSVHIRIPACRMKTLFSELIFLSIEREVLQIIR